MKVSGNVSIHLKLKDFSYPREAYDTIRAEIGEKSPAKMLSEYIYRILQESAFKDQIDQVSAIPDQWED